MQNEPCHWFHIPVMGLAYTIDTPLKVARYGISSAISIVQDQLIEKMRSHYYPLMGRVYHPITRNTPDHRAKRITDYLNFVRETVERQVEAVRQAHFEAGSEINKYFEMLPDGSLKDQYNLMVLLPESMEKHRLQEQLRSSVVAGSIDVNIMTKLDKENLNRSGKAIVDGSDAVSAVRGYAMSRLTQSSLVLSAGMNPRLFSYMERLSAFDADEQGGFEKKIVIKVSDYRSALIQGKMLAKKGLWVSEFRIESGLNCGGHAFATDGYLLGPILEEFKSRRDELTDTLFQLYQAARVAKGKPAFTTSHPLRITVQGGIGTHEEQRLLQQQFGVDGTGWGTPFLLVPEATTVDEETLRLLGAAKEKDVVLSKHSPLGVRFHYLKGTSAESERRERMAQGQPGSPCTERYLVSNTEFGAEPLCTASRTYQKKKIAQIRAKELPEAERQKQIQEVLDKECLCVGLSNAAVKNYGTKPFPKMEGVNICPGPNIAYFDEVVSLRRMVDHIYGRANLIKHTDRPHMFIKELTLYVDYWMEQLQETHSTLDHKRRTYLENFRNNLIDGIRYYRQLAETVSNEFSSVRDRWSDHLRAAEQKLEQAFAGVTQEPSVHAEGVMSQ